MTRRAKFWAWAGSLLLGLMLILAVVSIQVLKSAWFESYVREKIISVAEESTGARVEIGSFRFDWHHLQATIDNFVLHGTETPPNAPLFAARRIELRLKLLAGLKKAVDLEYLGVDRPAANVIVFPDRGTNIPEPKVVKQSHKTAVETVVDLAIGRFEISSGTVSFSQQSIAFSGRGENLQVQLNYRPGPAGYQGDVKIGSLQLKSAAGQPLNASIDLPVEIASDSIQLKNAGITTHDSQLRVTATISHIAQPVVDAHAIAHVSLAEIQRTTGLAMDACENNTPCYGDADLEARLDQQSVQVSKANLQIGATRLDASGTKSDLQFNAKLALNEIGRLFRVAAEPRGEVTATGSAQNLGTDRYTASAKISGAGIAVGTGSTGLPNISLAAEAAADRNKLELRSFRLGALGGELDGSASLADYSQLRLNGQLKNLSIRDFEQGPAVYDGTVNGRVEATGNLKMSGTTGIRAEAQLNIAPGSRGVPVSGAIQAAYDGSRKTVQIGHGRLTLPHSRLDLAGVLGSLVTVDISSTNLDDLYPAIAMSSSDPPKTMPVTLRGGRVAVHAEVTGVLSSPKIVVHVDADRLSVAQRAFDRLVADVSASADNAVVANGSLVHQGLQGQFSGALGLKRWSPQRNSPVQLSLDVHNGDVADLLALAGDSDIPATGATDLSVRLNGTFGNPQGAAHIVAENGEAFQQRFDKADAQIDLSDQLIRLTALDVTAPAGRIEARGTYTHPRDSMATGQAQVQVSGMGIQLGQIAILEKQHPGMSGEGQLNANATLTVRQTNGSSEVALSRIKGDLEARGLRDPKHNYGDLTAHADTSGSNVTFDVASNLAGSGIRVTGSSGLTKDCPTTADVSIQNLQIENALALAGETLPASGLLGVTGRVAGTIRDPSADLQLNLTSAKIYGEPIDRLQSTIQYSSKLIELSSLRLAAPAGSFTLTGSFAHREKQYNAGKIELHAQSEGIQLARVQNIQQRKPGVAGTFKLLADFAGEINGPDVSISKLEANVSASGISYNGHFYGGATLVAANKGNSVTFKADSDLAGASIHGEGEAGLQSGYPVNAKLTLANLRYSGLRGWFGDESLVPGFEALLEANASMSGPLAKPDDLKGNLQVTRLEVSRTSSPVALKNDGVMAIEYDRGSVRIQNAHLTGKSTDIAIGGTAAWKGASPLNLTVKANTNLGLLQDLSREIRSSGSVTVDATVRGNFSQPLANGSLQLKDASFNMEGVPNGISNANGTIALNGTGASIRSLTAESGGGRLTLSGFATLTGTTLRYTVNAKADHVRTRYEGISLVNSAGLTLSGTSQRSLLNGNVTVERVTYNPQSDIGSTLAQLTQTQPPSSSDTVSAIAAAMHLDIRIRTAPAVRFETTMTQALEANADLNLEGTLQHTGLVGTINITKGDLIFFGNEYTVDRGTISFADPGKIDPRLSIDLETTVESVTVTLGVTGPMNDLKLSYRSDPPLRFDEIVGLLASGKRPSSDPNIVANQAAPPQQSVAQLGETALVSQAVASPLSSRLQRVFGVNQLRIDPTFASGSALPQARVSLQQRIADTITFTYTQDLSQSNSELVRVEWAMSPKFSAIATRDENGIFGLDFFYKRQYR